MQLACTHACNHHFLVNPWRLMYADCSLLWFQITFWQLQLDRHRLKMSKVAERWAILFVSLCSLAIDLFIEPLNGLTRCGIKSSDDLAELLGLDNAFSERQRWRHQILDGYTERRFVISSAQKRGAFSKEISILVSKHRVSPSCQALPLFQFEGFHIYSSLQMRQLIHNDSQRGYGAGLHQMWQIIIMCVTFPSVMEIDVIHILSVARPPKTVCWATQSSTLNTTPSSCLQIHPTPGSQMTPHSGSSKPGGCMRQEIWVFRWTR